MRSPRSHGRALCGHQRAAAEPDLRRSCPVVAVAVLLLSPLGKEGSRQGGRSRQVRSPAGATNNCLRIYNEASAARRVHSLACLARGQGTYVRASACLCVPQSARIKMYENAGDGSGIASGRNYGSTHRAHTRLRGPLSGRACWISRKLVCFAALVVVFFFFLSRLLSAASGLKCTSLRFTRLSRVLSRVGFGFFCFDFWLG